MKNSQKGFALLTILLIAAGILVVGGAEYWWYQNQNKAPELIGGQTDEHGCLGPAGYSWCEVKQKCLRVWEEKCEATSTAQTSNSQTAGWKTYSNNDLGFEFQYPPSLGNPSPQKHIKTSGMVQDSVSFNDQLILSSDVYYNQSTNQPMTVEGLTSFDPNRKQIIVGGKNGVEVIGDQFGIVVYIPLSGDTIFTIEYAPHALSDQIFLNQILSTFKFNP